MKTILGGIVAILIIAISLIRLMPFIPTETKIEWITNIGLVLMFVTGGAAFGIVKNALIAVIVGAVIFAIIMGFLESLPA